MSYNRREFIRKSSIVSGVMALNFPSPMIRSCSDADRLVLLGTQGGPFIRSYKQTPSSNLIVYKNMPFIIDTGYGVTFRLLEVGIALSSIKYIFITHHHSDHNLELGPLLYNAWIGGLKKPVHVYGPAGLTSLLFHYWESNRFDIDTRIKDESRADIRKLVIGHEISGGNILSVPGIEVNAMKNIHPPIEESYAFKFKLDGKVIVFSGDTTYCPALASFSAGADYLVHEIMIGKAVDEMVKRRPNVPNLKASILSHHTLAEDVGKIAAQAKVKTLVLNHFVPPDDKSISEQTWIDAVRTNFQGNIIVGKDLLEILL